MTTIVFPHIQAAAPRGISVPDTAARGAARPALMAHSVVSFAIPFVDFVAACIIFYVVAACPAVSGSGLHDASLRMIAGVIAVFAWVRLAGLYELRRYLSAWPAAARGLPPLGIGIAVEGIALWWAGVSPTALLPTLGTAAIAGTSYLIMSRLFWAWLCRCGLRSGHLVFRVALAGSGCADWLGQHAARRNPFLSVVGHYDLDPAATHGGADLDLLLTHARTRRIDAIVLCYPEAVAERRRQAFLMLRASVADIFLRDDLSRCRLLPRHHPLAGFAIIPLQLRALTDADMVCKAVIDRVGGLFLLLALSPIFALTAIAIQLDSPGPVFFRQPRVGYNNVLFEMFKFRSMKTHLSDRLAMRQTTQHDPRVTRVGRLIRRTSIDELPQLFNVIRGEMSLVGPRPHAPGTNVEGLMLEHAAAGYPLRHRVLPGITGWAQINGSRGAILTPEQLRRRVRLDLHYIQKRSMLLDLKIVFLTATREILSRRAC